MIEWSENATCRARKLTFAKTFDRHEYLSMITGRAPSVAVVIMFFDIRFFAFYRRNIEEHYGGYKLLLNTDLKVNLSIKFKK